MTLQQPARWSGANSSGAIQEIRREIYLCTKSLLIFVRRFFCLPTLLDIVVFYASYISESSFFDLPKAFSMVNIV